MKRILLLPSAKVVPQELQILGKLPAIIYPLNTDVVLDFMIKQYKSRIDMYEIIAYEQSDKINERLKKYSAYDIKLISLDKILDLGYTVYYGLKNILSNSEESYEITINFADTILLDDIDNAFEDCLYYSEDFVNEKWTYFDENKGVINNILDKKQQADITDKLSKLFIGVFKIVHIYDFMKCLKLSLNSTTDMDSFYFALMEYSKMHPMRVIKATNWFDIGHVDKYYNSMLGVRAREFNHITIDKERGILKKTSDDKEKFIGEILWYLKLPADIEYVHPRIFAYSTDYNEPYVMMEYYSYHTVHELFLNGDLSYNQWVDIFNRIKFICNDLSRYKVSDSSIKSELEDIYLTKTIQRLDRLRKDDRFAPFFNKNFSVNGIEYKSLNEICSLLKVLVPQELYDVCEFNIIHGDLCFSNIMVDSNFTFIKVIDPRGKFGKYDIYGDPRYELAKLFHSVDGRYDFIIKDMFTIDADIDKCYINFKIADRKRDFHLYECFLSCFKDKIGDDISKIELIEALLFLSMIPLHGENIKHQYVMLGTGMQILDRCADVRA